MSKPFKMKGSPMQRNFGIGESETPDATTPLNFDLGTAISNIGQNIGEAAGQKVMWPHIHFIPREKGDCKENASNGIRLSHPGGVQINELRT